MRKLFLACMLAGTLAAQAQGRFTIEGTLSGVDEGTVLGLYKDEGGVGTEVAVDTLRNGRFFFEGMTTSNEVEEYDVMAKDYGKLPPVWLSLWIGPDTHLKVKGENKLLKTWRVEGGSECQRFQQQLVDASRKELDAFQQLTMEGMALGQTLQNASGEQRESIIAKLKQMQDEQDSLQRCVMANNIRLMKQTAVNKVWMNSLNGLGMLLKYDKKFLHRDEVKALYESLPDEWKNTEEGKSVYTALYPPVVVNDGEMAVDGDLYDLQGKVHHLSEFRGKYILLDFWSRGCGPCIQSQPELKEISELHKDSLEVVSLSIETEKGWRASVKDHPLAWNNWNDLQGRNGISARYGVNGIPHFVLIAPDGHILKSWTGYGPGLLKVQLRRWMHPRPQTVYGTHEGNPTVDYPVYGSSNTDALQITQVERTDTATIVRIHAYYIPKYWIRLSKETHLVADDGTSCPVLRSEGFPLGERFFMPESGEATFTLYFAPLPAGTRTFDFTEGDGADSWQIKGIRLME